MRAGITRGPLPSPKEGGPPPGIFEFYIAIGDF